LLGNKVFRSWGRILSGKSPVLSIEITNKCPLSCPGCYAFHPEHVSGRSLNSISDFTGDELVERVLALVRKKRPVGLFLVGGEPLVRLRELRRLVPELSAMGVTTEIVTSAVIPIPIEWKHLPGVSVVVSVDGLQPDHDRRRKPATYQKILENIKGREVIIHCTVTSQMASKADSLREFAGYWGGVDEVSSIRFSLYTPQVGETSEEILSPDLRKRVVEELRDLQKVEPKLRLNSLMLDAYLSPPQNPRKCIFASITECLSSDLETEVTPCQLGGNPDCRRCGCVAAMGCQAIGDYRIPGGLALGGLFRASRAVGEIFNGSRK